MKINNPILSPPSQAFGPESPGGGGDTNAVSAEEDTLRALRKWMGRMAAFKVALPSRRPPEPVNALAPLPHTH